jgi:DUF971 family protein
MVSPHDTRLHVDEGSGRILPLRYEGVALMSYGFATDEQTRPGRMGQDARASGAPSASTAIVGSDSASPSSSSSPSSSTSGAFLRGPLASGAVRQLTGGTEWGDLDYLIIDFPPGTGDIQLTLTQHLRLRAAVVVSTPQRLAVVDVDKGAALFRATGVPLAAVVLNMATFTCGTCSTQHRLFGSDGVARLRELAALHGAHGGGGGGGGSEPRTRDADAQDVGEAEEESALIELPLLPALSESADRGDPFVLKFTATSAHPQSADKQDSGTSGSGSGSGAGAQDALVRDAFLRLARRVRARCERAARVDARVPHVRYDPASKCVVVAKASIPARALRLACRCAACVDEGGSGRVLIDVARVPPDVRPVSMQVRGNYAVAVRWSDGHASSLYTLEHLHQLAATHAPAAHTQSSSSST